MLGSATPQVNAGWLRQGRALRPPPTPAGAVGPLRLVGGFCEWQLDVKGLEFEELGEVRRDGWLEHRLHLRLRGEQVEFQVVSTPMGFGWRLFPARTGFVLERSQPSGAGGEVLLGGEGDGHGLNFCLCAAPGSELLLQVRLKAPPGGARSGPPVAAELMYELLSVGVRPTVELGTGLVTALTALGGGASAWSNDPRTISLDDVGALRLVGRPCSWRLEHRGLVLEPGDVAGAVSGWRLFTLCFRMLTRTVDFQIVSDRLGFRYRLFPEGAAVLVPRAAHPDVGLVATLGGKDEGHGQNFRVLGDPLDIVTLSVWLEESLRGSPASGPVTGRACVGYSLLDTGVQVSIGVSRVHYPPRTVTPLGPELLELAETDEERSRVVEMRNDLVRRMCWQLQKEYGEEDVQREVLALRQLYPYRQRKGLLALEIEKEHQRGLAALADLATSTVADSAGSAAAETNGTPRDDAEGPVVEAASARFPWKCAAPTAESPPPELETPPPEVASPPSSVTAGIHGHVAIDETAPPCVDATAECGAALCVERPPPDRRGGQAACDVNDARAADLAAAVGGSGDVCVTDCVDAGAFGGPGRSVPTAAMVAPTGGTPCVATTDASDCDVCAVVVCEPALGAAMGGHTRVSDQDEKRGGGGIFDFDDLDSMEAAATHEQVPVTPPMPMQAEAAVPAASAAAAPAPSEAADGCRTQDTSTHSVVGGELPPSPPPPSPPPPSPPLWSEAVPADAAPVGVMDFASVDDAPAGVEAEVAGADAKANNASERGKFLRLLCKAVEVLEGSVAKARLDGLRAVCTGRVQFDRLKFTVLPELAAIFMRDGGMGKFWQRLGRCFGEADVEVAIAASTVDRLLAIGGLGPKDLAKGDCVRVAGLSLTAGGAALNGRLGAITGFNEASRTYDVSLQSGHDLSLPPESLQPADDSERFKACRELISSALEESAAQTQVSRLRAASASAQDFEGLLPRFVWRPMLDPHLQRLGVDRQWYFDQASMVAEVGGAEARRRAGGLERLSFGGLGATAAWGGFPTEVLGTWRYGSKNNEYLLSLDDRVEMCFEGPHITAGRVFGVLRVVGAWLEADVGPAGRDPIGRVRLRFSRLDGTMVSNYMSLTKGAWGKDIVARRPPAPGAAPEPAPAGVPLALTAGAAPLALAAAPAAVGGGQGAQSRPLDGTEENEKWMCMLGLNILKQQMDEATRTIESVDGDDSSEAGSLAGVRRAQLQHLRLQQKTLERTLRGEVVANQGQLFGAGITGGGTESEFSAVLQSLPSVKAARARAARAVGLPEDMVISAIRFGEQRHEEDRLVNEANHLTLVRLRFYATPHPATLEQAAKALKERGFFVGGPPEWFSGLDTSVHTDWAATRVEVEQCWNGGLFKHWFGGPRAGRYMITSVEELWDVKAKAIHSCTIQVKDQLRLLLRRMGEEGRRLRVESRVLLAYHAQGQVLPPWEDAAGRRTRRLTLTFHLSTAHAAVKDGGALRLHRAAVAGNRGDAARRAGEKQRTGVVAEIPAGGGHWCVFTTHEFKQEVAKVNLPCGRWCICVCAEDASAAEELEKRQLTARSGAAAVSQLDSPPKDNFEEIQVNCSQCGFAAGDGIVLPCPMDHRLCRECLQREVRRAAVATCPSCAAEGDRVYASLKFDLLESAGLDDLGCVCSDEHVDPGARVIIFGQCKTTELNGKLAEAIWWNEQSRSWDVRVFATRRVASVPASCLQLAECCPAGGELCRCPCWPMGRGVYPISLGNRCCTKLGIDECTGPIEAPGGYPYFHGQEFMPFDSILTSFDGIMYFLRHNFAHFFHYDNCLDVSPKQCPRVIFNTYRSTLHAFPHHHPRKDHEKLGRRLERFRLLCRHSRDARGARVPLFIRFVGCDAEFARIEELYSLLRLWAGARARLFLVSMLQVPHGATPQVFRHSVFPRILFFFTSWVGVMDFGPIKEACRLAVYDEAGLLACDTISTKELLQRAKPFSDPYTTESSECKETWLLPLKGREARYFPDCPEAEKSWQSRGANEMLRKAVRRSDVRHVAALLEEGADANSWDEAGRTALHEVVELAGRSMKVNDAVHCAAALLLAHGDPRCPDRAGLTPLQLAFKRPPPRSRDPCCPCEVRTLLQAAALDDGPAADTPPDAAALHRSLEALGEPWRSRLARVLGLDAVRALGEAELAWRNPPPDSETVLAQISEELRAMESLSEAERKRAAKRLLLEWHPDKNAHRLSLATTVFQYLQAHKGGVIAR